MWKWKKPQRGKENWSFCLPSGAIVMESLCHTLVAKGNTGQTSVMVGAGKLWTPARGFFCVQTWAFLLVPGSRYEVGWGFLLVQQQKLYHIHRRAVPAVTLAWYRSHIVLFTCGGWVFIGFGFNEAGELDLGEGPPQAHTCAHAYFMSPQEGPWPDTVTWMWVGSEGTGPQP